MKNACETGPGALGGSAHGVFPALGLALALGIVSSCTPPPPQGTPTAPPASQPAPSTPPPTSVPVPLPTPRPPIQLDHDPSIDVGLAVDLDSLSFAPLRAVTLESGGEDAGTIGDASRAPIRVRREDDRWMLSWVPEGGVRHDREITVAETLWVGDAAGDGGEPTFRWGDKTWRGRFKVFVNARGKLTLASRLPLEPYLIGVVPGEIGGLSESLLEAGRAQAIAARSYTLFYRGRRGSEGFDLYGTVEDQVYGPVEGERPLATRCVETTRGQVALSGGDPIRANYYSTCGGITADVWEAWPANPLPYLVSHRDARSGRGDHCGQSPLYRWREEWPAADFLEIVAANAPAEGIGIPADGMGDLVDVRVEARSHSGRVWRLSIRTTTGTIQVPAYALRRVLRRPSNRVQILRSNLFKVDVRRSPETREAIAVVVSGAGSGHGVGLCQTGAIGMARQGDRGEQILTHYYPGIELRRLY